MLNEMFMQFISSGNVQLIDISSALGIVSYIFRKSSIICKITLTAFEYPLNQLITLTDKNLIDIKSIEFRKILEESENE